MEGAFFSPQLNNTSSSSLVLLSFSFTFLPTRTFFLKELENFIQLLMVVNGREYESGKIVWKCIMSKCGTREDGIT